MPLTTDGVCWKCGSKEDVRMRRTESLFGFKILCGRMCAKCWGAFGR